MQLTGFGIALWLMFLWEGNHAELGIARWRPQMHWLDKLAWYIFMAVGPMLLGFLLGVALGGRKRYANAKAAGKFDAETMKLIDDPGQQAYWGCRKCIRKAAGLECPTSPPNCPKALRLSP